MAMTPTGDPTIPAPARVRTTSGGAVVGKRRRAPRSAAGAPAPAPAEPTGIARVAVDVPLPHLDRFFDYAVPAAMEDAAVPGARVRVRFSGQSRPGFIVERPTTTPVEGTLTPLTKVISPEPVLSSAQVSLIRTVADHWGGTFADVMRLAVPPRHAATEHTAGGQWPAPALDAIPGGGLLGYPRGREWLRAVEDGRPVRAFWQEDAAWRDDRWGVDDWTRGAVQAVAAALRAGRGAIVVVPDARDIARTRAALEGALGVGVVAVLHHELGPAMRYRNYLGLSRGETQVALGTRPAVFAPVRDLGLIVVVDDGDDLLAERHAPYPHARDVAALRAVTESSALLLASTARSCEAQQWIARGWLGTIEQSPAERRRRGPLVRVAADTNAALQRDPLAQASRMPHQVFDTIRAGLAAGPVLVQVPRAGYLVALACARCRVPARCAACHGPLQVRAGELGRQIACGWCGRPTGAWRCAACDGRELRAPRVGSTRTAEELGRAFPGYRLVDSAAEHVVARVGEQPALVVATPGAEPAPDAGYAAAVLLDTDLMAGRDDLRAGEEALRRWFAATALVRPAAEGGTVCVVGDPSSRAIQALVRLDAAGFARAELTDRDAARYPPAVRFITLDGELAPLRDFLDALSLPEQAEVLGPVETPPVRPDDPPGQYRAVLRAPLPHGADLTRAVKAAAALRSSRKSPGIVRVQVDPAAIA